MPDAAPPPGRRITIALEASEAGRPILDACARLAVLLGAELEGIFVEDSDLLRLPGLSFLRELRPASLREEAFSALRMERELRTLARQAERMLEQVAGELGVPWSFRIWRGPAGAATLAGSLAKDFLGLAQTGRRAALRLWATGGRRTHAAARPVSGVSVLYSDVDDSGRASQTAAQLAQVLGVPLTVWLPPSATAMPAALHRRLADLLAGHPLHVRRLPVTDDAPRLLADAVATSGAGIVVAPAGHPLFRESGLEPCLEALSCPVLLVR